MANNLASLVVTLEAQTAKYQSELEKAKRQLGLFEKKSNEAVAKIAKAAGAAALAAATGFALMAKAAIDTADNLNDMSKQTGISVESLSRLGYAAQLSGADLEGVGKGLQRLSTAMADAANGLQEPARAFKQLGIEIKNADGSLRDSEQMLLQIADVFSQYEDGAGKAAIAQDLFGKSGLQLIPFLNQGRKGIEALTKEADRLGVTISSKTAAAADEFNDNIQRLKSGFVGLANQVASRMLPMLENLTAQFAGSATEGEAFARAADVISTTLKLLISSGLVVGEVFDRIGSALGAAAAAVMAVARGEFKQAFDIIKMSQEDTRTSVSQTANQISAVWSDAGKSIVDTAQKTDAELKKSFAFGGGKDAVQEVQITAKKIESSPMDQFYKELNEKTKTQNEQALATYHEQIEASKELLRSRIIDEETYQARRKEALDTLLPEFEVTVKKIKETTEKATNELNEFQKQAMRNTQDIIADALTNGFEGGAKGMLKAFGQMIVQLTAQAVAADLAGKLFGSGVSGNKSDGAGWINTALQIFGGFMANGGNVSPNEAYVVGERGPEMFVPNTAGKIVPNHKMGGNVTNHFVIEAPNGSVSRQTQMQVAAAAARGVAQANRRNN